MTVTFSDVISVLALVVAGLAMWQGRSAKKLAEMQAEELQRQHDVVVRLRSMPNGQDQVQIVNPGPEPVYAVILGGDPELLHPGDVEQFPLDVLEPGETHEMSGLFAKRSRQFRVTVRWRDARQCERERRYLLELDE
jgi:hypothetical protein